MKRSLAVLLAVIVGIAASLTTFVVTSYAFSASLKGSDDSLSLAEFMTVEKIIEENYLRDYDTEEIQYAGLKAMVAALDDPYSVYYTPEEYQTFNQEASGEYYGLGMVISIDEVTGLAMVEYFFDGSAAREAGIEAGDLIISVNGLDVTDKTLQEISVLCIGEKGTAITIGIKRGDDVLEFEMVRSVVTIDMLSYEMLDDEIGYMKIVQFGGNCEELFKKAVDYFEQNGTRGIVIDLRDNPGGYLDTVVAVLDILLPEGKIVYTKDKYGEGEVYLSDADCLDMAITLIVNGNTASAAEIFAGAVQDYDYGKVVGTTTYGKGVVQVIIPITSTGGGIKLTTSEYFTPNGRSIDGNGIYPDYVVELQQEFLDNPEAYTFDEDAQAQKAIEVLREELE
ncbi:MAG: S41 family peptidase [Eubacteriales bacterium]|nr:S41 family peptidase [Eubacteriales bacterium]